MKIQIDDEVREATPQETASILEVQKETHENDPITSEQ